jgi:phosphatidylglycerol lysyltransferase
MVWAAGTPVGALGRVTLAAGVVWARIGRLLAISAAALLVGLAGAALYHALHDIGYRAVIDGLTALPGRLVVAALAAAAANFVVLLANDFAALRYARATSPVVSTLLASFCGYAVGNFVGFGALSGGAVRYRVYARAGMSGAKVARISLFIAAAFAIGATETFGLGLALRSGEIARLYGLPADSLRLVAALILAATVAGLIGCALGRRSLRLGPLAIELPGLGLVLCQIVVNVGEITLGASVLWLLLPASGIDFPGFVVIYTAAATLGVLSHAPGGIGVFDAAVLYAIGAHGSTSVVAAALVAYRAIYFLLPMAIATVLLLALELQRLPRRV